MDRTRLRLFEGLLTLAVLCTLGAVACGITLYNTTVTQKATITSLEQAIATTNNDKVTAEMKCERIEFRLSVAEEQVKQWQKAFEDIQKIRINEAQQK